ncbi:MAG: hypothetical protein KAT58_06530, partial [candidate division Zixibacteria bacterium]|nr:hypothetical protein [candidate division Zixibacteria bacterium]
MKIKPLRQTRDNSPAGWGTGLLLQRNSDTPAEHKVSLFVIEVPFVPSHCLFVLTTPKGVLAKEVNAYVLSYKTDSRGYAIQSSRRVIVFVGYEDGIAEGANTKKYRRLKFGTYAVAGTIVYIEIIAVPFNVAERTVLIFSRQQ